MKNDYYETKISPGMRYYSDYDTNKQTPGGSMLGGQISRVQGGASDE